MRNKTGGIVLKDYLLDVMQRHEQGLYLCELPTGNGKTYDSAHAMKEYADSIVDDTKIIYLTMLNKICLKMHCELHMEMMICIIVMY